MKTPLSQMKMITSTWQAESSVAGFSRLAMGVLLVAIACYAFTADAVEKPQKRARADAALADPDRPRAEFVPGELLVGFNPGARAQEEALRNAIGAQKLKEWPALQAQHWRLPPGLDVGRAVRMLSANPNVAYPEPNYAVIVSAPARAARKPVVET